MARAAAARIELAKEARATLQLRRRAGGRGRRRAAVRGRREQLLLAPAATGALARVPAWGCAAALGLVGKRLAPLDLDVSLLLHAAQLVLLPPHMAKQPRAHAAQKLATLDALRSHLLDECLESRVKGGHRLALRGHPPVERRFGGEHVCTARQR